MEKEKLKEKELSEKKKSNLVEIIKRKDEKNKSELYFPKKKTKILKISSNKKSNKKKYSNKKEPETKNEAKSKVSNIQIINKNNILSKSLANNDQKSKYFDSINICFMT